jgi:excisionase family DNA binding protein
MGALVTKKNQDATPGEPSRENRSDQLEKHYRARTLAPRLGISLSFAKLLLARRDIETVRVGTAVLVSESAVLTYLAKHRIPARESADHLVT